MPMLGMYTCDSVVGEDDKHNYGNDTYSEVEYTIGEHDNIIVKDVERIEYKPYYDCFRGFREIGWGYDFSYDEDYLVVVQYKFIYLIHNGYSIAYNDGNYRFNKSYDTYCRTKYCDDGYIHIEDILGVVPESLKAEIDELVNSEWNNTKNIEFCKYLCSVIDKLDEQIKSTIDNFSLCSSVKSARSVA